MLNISIFLPCTLCVFYLCQLQLVTGFLEVIPGGYLVSKVVESKRDEYTFPHNFIFGVSSSAYQIEGAWNEDGKGESQWDSYLHQNPNFTRDGSNGDVTADSYHRYREDIELIKGLGVDFYRLSISWSRLLPNGTTDNINKQGVIYYRRLIDELLKVNIKTVITLYHWDLPTVFMNMGGWTNPVIIDYFEDYVRVVFGLFGDLVKIWITINEPHMNCNSGYGGTESWPTVPNISSPGLGIYKCFHHQLLAHARAYQVYHHEFRPYQKGVIGLTLDAAWVMPKNPLSSYDQKAVNRYLQMHVGLFMHPIFSKSGDYPSLVRELVDSTSFLQGFRRSRLPYFTQKEIQELRHSADFLGLNHYTTSLASSSSMEEGWSVPSYNHDTGVKTEQNASWPVPGPVWLSVYPPGMRKLLNWITYTYGSSIPIIITENGVADRGQIEDYERISYYNKYLNEILKAIYEDGCNVIGYFAWSLMDSFEWYDGFTSKFGLYHVDYSSPNRTRTAKLSAKNYREIVRTRKINFNYLTKSNNYTKH